MLARRFTIVCLLMTLFGMAFAILVADASRHARSRAFESCVFETTTDCQIRSGTSLNRMQS